MTIHHLSSDNRPRHDACSACPETSRSDGLPPCKRTTYLVAHSGLARASQVERRVTGGARRPRLALVSQRGRFWRAQLPRLSADALPQVERNRSCRPWNASERGRGARDSRERLAHRPPGGARRHRLALVSQRGRSWRAQLPRLSADALPQVERNRPVRPWNASERGRGARGSRERLAHRPYAPCATP